MIGVIDFRTGNLGSLLNAFKYLGASAEIISSPDDIDSCKSILLPGVGSFDTAMSFIESSNFVSFIQDFVAAGGPVLGICLGMQLLTCNSEEGVLPGLDLIKSSTVSLRNLGCNGKLPHVGFNTINSVSGESLFFSDALGRDFYFVHSYAIPHDVALESCAFTDYENARFIAAFQQQNIFATQFHPEKSGEAGLIMLEHFISCSKSA